MLVADLGKYDMILGRKWFADHDVLLDCRRYRMIWLDEKTLFDDVASKMAVPTPTAILQKPKPNPDHQADADRRDRLFGQKESKTKDGYKYTCERQYGYWQVEEQRKMSRNLNDESKPKISKIR